MGGVSAHMFNGEQSYVWNLPIDFHRLDKKTSLIFTPLVNKLPKEVRSQLPRPPYTFYRTRLLIDCLKDSQDQGPAYKPCPFCYQIECKSYIVFYCGGCSRVVRAHKLSLHNWWCSQCEWKFQQLRFYPENPHEVRQARLFESAEQFQLALLHWVFHLWVTAVVAQSESHIIHIYCKESRWKPRVPR